MYCSILSDTLTSALVASDSKNNFREKNKTCPITVRAHLSDGVCMDVANDQVLEWIGRQQREKCIIYSYIPWSISHVRLSNILDYFFTRVNRFEMTAEEAKWFRHPLVHKRSVFIFTPSWYHFYFYL